jgi:hypothetical protein
VKLGIKEKRQGKGEEEGYMERKVHIGNKWWKLTTNDSKKTCRRCNEIKEGRSFTLGDFNWRIGERGSRNWEEERGDGKRKFKDKMENGEGKRLMKWIEKNGWEAFNGNKQGDEGSWEKW